MAIAEDGLDGHRVDGQRMDGHPVGGWATTAPACAACGGREVEIDAVGEAEALLLLGECGRCGHRWTASPGSLPPPSEPPAAPQRRLRPVRRRRAEAATAA